MLLALMVLPFAWKLATGDQFLTVTSKSMQPTYMVGDVVVMQRADGDVLADKGQPVVVRMSGASSSGAPYVHRVEQPLSDGRAYLKGDNNAQRDPLPVSPEQVLGVPRAVLAGPLASILTFSQSILGRVVLGGAALALLLVKLPRRTSASAAASAPESESDPESESESVSEPADVDDVFSPLAPALHGPALHGTGVEPASSLRGQS
ncbi:S24 family peptidase [Gryllotalpicola reticulitermitis]|uniref:S24 family peptidase n=1 Tax=Gryllotalpicola reticulitermitis TaxID=1184153 RepID=A0ABV8QBV8_9MICO